MKAVTPWFRIQKSTLPSRQWRAWAAGITLVATAAVAGLATLPVATAGQGAAPTRIVHFRAFAADGRIVGLRVTRTLRGSCWVGSIGLPRPDAWRCMVGNEILDPCLVSPKGARVPLVCVVGTEGVRLRLTKPLPEHYRNPPEETFFAWRLVLPGSVVCERFTGTAAGEVQGQGLVYGCTSGGTTTEPDRARTTWTVRYLRRGVSPSRVKRLAQLELLPVVRAVG